MSQDQTLRDGYLQFSHKLSEADQHFYNSEFEECLSVVEELREKVEDKIK